MRIAALVAIASSAMLAACGSSATETTSDVPSASVTPTSFVLAAGDSSSVTVFSNRAGTVHWHSTNTSVVTVDSLVDTGTPAVVRAHTAGAAQLNATVILSGQTYTTSVPVRVGAG